MNLSRLVKTISILTALSMLMPALTVVGPVSASQPSSNFRVNPMYDNYFYWFGENGFNTNVAFGAWSNCPVMPDWLSSSPQSYPTSNPACLVATANGNNAFQNSGWDSNAEGGLGNYAYQDFTLSGNTLEVPGICFINDQFVQIGCVAMVFHGEHSTSSNVWIANPENPANSMQLADSNGVYGKILLGGVAVFSGIPGESTFVSLTVQEWSYRTPASYAANSGAMPDAIFVPNQQAYLQLTGVWYFTPAPLSSAAMTSLVQTTAPLPSSPAGQSAYE